MVSTFRRTSGENIFQKHVATLRARSSSPVVDKASNKQLKEWDGADLGSNAGLALHIFTVGINGSFPYRKRSFSKDILSFAQSKWGSDRKR
jgi:hypothetical protein